MSTNRLEAFSDGVFAVAITLLVFGLTVPASSSGGLWSALGKEWPAFASYGVSFLIIGIIWINHHTIFSQIARVDRTLMFINLLLLMSVVFIPFATEVLAKYIQSGSASHAAAVLYSATMLAMSISFFLIWAYAIWKEDLLADGVDPHVARATLPRFGIGNLIYLLTIGVGLVSAVACLTIHALIALYYIVDQTSTPSRTTQAAGEAMGASVQIESNQE